MISTTPTFAAIDIGPRITLTSILNRSATEAAQRALDVAQRAAGFSPRGPSDKLNHASHSADSRPDTPTAEIETFSASWPLRATLQNLSIFTSPANRTAPTSSLPPSHIDLLRSAHTLVCMGNTRLSAACQIAALAGIDTVVVPACRCALWSEGAVTFSEIREYHREVEGPLDLDMVRLRFVEMMEDAAGYTQALTLEQDDSLLDRYAELQLPSQDESLTIPIESLTDTERFLRPLRAARPGQLKNSALLTSMTVKAVHMRCMFSSLYPLPRTHFDETPWGWHECTTTSGLRWYRRVDVEK